MMTRWTGLAGVVVVLGFASDGWSRGPAASAQGTPSSGVAASGKGKRQDVRQRIQMVRIWELSRVLGLDTKAAASLFPTLNQFDERRAVAQRKVREAMQSLKKAIGGSVAKSGLQSQAGASAPQGAVPSAIGDAPIQALMDRLASAKAEFHRVEMEEMAEVRKLLTPAQQAKYVLFQQRFEQRMQRIIRKVREARAGKNLPLED